VSVGGWGEKVGVVKHTPAPCRAAPVQSPELCVWGLGGSGGGGGGSHLLLIGQHPGGDGVDVQPQRLDSHLHHVLPQGGPLAAVRVLLDGDGAVGPPGGRAPSGPARTWLSAGPGACSTGGQSSERQAERAGMWGIWFRH